MAATTDSTSKADVADLARNRHPRPAKRTANSTVAARTASLRTVASGQNHAARAGQFDRDIFNIPSGTAVARHRATKRVAAIHTDNPLNDSTRDGDVIDIPSAPTVAAVSVGAATSTALHVDAAEGEADFDRGIDNIAAPSPACAPVRVAAFASNEIQGAAEGIHEIDDHGHLPGMAASPTSTAFTVSAKSTADGELANHSARENIHVRDFALGTTGKCCAAIAAAARHDVDVAVDAGTYLDGDPIDSAGHSAGATGSSACASNTTYDSHIRRRVTEGDGYILDTARHTAGEADTRKSTASRRNEHQPFIHLPDDGHVRDRAAHATVGERAVATRSGEDLNAQKDSIDRDFFNRTTVEANTGKIVCTTARFDRDCTAGEPHVRDISAVSGNTEIVDLPIGLT